MTTPTSPRLVHRARPRGTARLLGAALLLAASVVGLGAGLDAGRAADRGDGPGRGDRASALERAERWREPRAPAAAPRPTPAPAPAQPAPAPTPAPTLEPPVASTIVEVGGNAADGFEIRHLDGTWDYPPTDSEAAAECGEYDTRVARAVCRADVDRWYRDLAEMKRSLAYAYAH